MFVVKSELKNAGQLARIKLNNGTRGGLYVCAAIVAGLLGTSLILIITGLFQATDEVKLYQGLDYWTMFPFAMLGIILGPLFTYRQTNQNYAVYPQTNTSRFLSAQALLYSGIVLFATIMLTLYLIQYGVIAAIAGFHRNVHLIYHFDIGFVVAGFFVLIILGAIVAGFMSLGAALIHKFRIFAIALFVVMFGLALVEPAVTLKLFKDVFRFLIDEHSVMLFVIKGLILWAVLFLLSLFINKHTVYYRDSTRWPKEISAVIVIACGFAAAFVVAIMVITASDFTSDIDMMDDDRPPGVTKKMTFDISSLPEGSKLNVITTGDVVMIPNGDQVIAVYSDGGGEDGEKGYYEYEDGRRVEFPSHSLTFEYGEQLTRLQGKRLVVSYTAPMQMADSEEIAHLMNPRFQARLEGNTLYLDYRYGRNVKAVSMQAWPFMTQFDYFRDKGIYNEYLPYKRSSNFSGYLEVTTE